jgi:hypothetical protein
VWGSHCWGVTECFDFKSSTQVKMVNGNRIVQVHKKIDDRKEGKCVCLGGWVCVCELARFCQRRTSISMVVWTFMIRGSPVSGATARSGDLDVVGRYRGIPARAEKVEPLYQHLCSLQCLLPVLACARTRQSCDTNARVSCVLFWKELKCMFID